MPLPGKLVTRSQDEHGPIIIHQSGELRYLSFDGKVEQSCSYTNKSHRLRHTYTQAMMLGIIFPANIEHLLILGLGAGTLANASLYTRSEINIDAIELRQAVIDLARAELNLSSDPRLQCICADAKTYLQGTNKNYQCQFIDLYDHDGMSPLQADQEFIEACSKRLSPNGVAVFNLWGEGLSGESSAIRAIRDTFNDRVYELRIAGGNRCVFAFEGALPKPVRRLFFAQCVAMGRQLEIPLVRHARALWSQNVGLV